MSDWTPTVEEYRDRLQTIQNWINYGAILRKSSTGAEANFTGKTWGWFDIVGEPDQEELSKLEAISVKRRRG